MAVGNGLRNGVRHTHGYRIYKRNRYNQDSNYHTGILRWTDNHNTRHTTSTHRIKQMKTMKRYILIFALMAFAAGASAQSPYGNNGHNYISNSTTAVAGNWYCFQAVTQCIVDTLIVTNQTGQYTFKGQTITADTIPAGTFLFWNVTRVKLTSGKACLYRKID